MYSECVKILYNEDGTRRDAIKGGCEMEYRIASVIVDSEGNIVEEGESVKLELDDGSVLIGCIVDIYSNEGTFEIECEYFTLDIGIGRIVSITKE